MQLRGRLVNGGGLLPRVRASRALWILLGRHGRLHMATSVQLPQEATRGERGPVAAHGGVCLGTGGNLVVEFNSRCKSSR